MKAINSLLGVFLCLSTISAFAQETPLSSPYDLKIKITEPSGKTREAHAVVLEGAKAVLRTNENVAPDGTTPLKIGFTVFANPTLTSRVGKETVDIDISLSRAEAGEWAPIASPKISTLLGSDRPATVTMGDKGYSISITAIKVDGKPYRDRILKLAKSAANCDLVKPGKTIAPISNQPNISAQCCCTVACPSGPTWTCCNVLSFNCGGNSCSPPGGYLCY